MNKIFVLHDIEESKAQELTSKVCENKLYFSTNPVIKQCIGCFGCWVKTPGQCIIKDRGKNLPKLWASASQVIIISELVYGGFSPSIKTCIDRSLGYVLPYFRMIKGEMHHKLRYKNKFSITAYFYGHSITKQEKDMASQLLKANALNYGAQESHTHFYKTIEDIGKIII